MVVGERERADGGRGRTHHYVEWPRARGKYMKARLDLHSVKSRGERERDRERESEGVVDNAVPFSFCPLNRLWRAWLLRLLLLRLSPLSQSSTSTDRCNAYLQYTPLHYAQVVLPRRVQLQKQRSACLCTLPPPD